MTEFTQLYLTPKVFLLGSSLAFSLKEDPVRCAKVCDKSWVILMRMLKNGQNCVHLVMEITITLVNGDFAQNGGNKITKTTEKHGPMRLRSLCAV